MIGEENFTIGNPNISFSTDNVILLINNLMRETVPYFRSRISTDSYTKKNLSEDDFTQFYVEEANKLIRNHNYPFNIGIQYRDVYNRSLGFSDIYFYPNEQTSHSSSLFSVECKRLPAPQKSREREYVIGDNKNGGIERYKTEKHGKGLNNCGLIAFVENDNFHHWQTSVNNWIEDLSKKDVDWKKEELLNLLIEDVDYCSLFSIAFKKDDKINLYHLWIKIP